MLTRVLLLAFATGQVPSAPTLDQETAAPSSCAGAP